MEILSNQGKGEKADPGSFDPMDPVGSCWILLDPVGSYGFCWILDPSGSYNRINIFLLQCIVSLKYIIFFKGLWWTQRSRFSFSHLDVVS